ncbi:outer membrane beta-barrel protein [Marinifilum sp. RC60d5]|uniref:outer membrane beta-barrel protein n=1 Tax=Marinifilum sp. RC60d5 TaxID=3458414 RepID=UPI0040350463
MNFKFNYVLGAFILIIGCFFTSSTAFANYQSEKLQTSIIQGKIIESQHKKPLEFATISVYSVKDSSFIKGAISNKKGVFVINQLKAGEYFLKVEYIGFNSFVGENFTLNGVEKRVLQTPIVLSVDTEALSEVTVQGQREFARVELNKTVYNISKSPLADGGTVTEVLTTIPKLSVNANGDVQFRGSSNVKILIDGKISGLLGMNPSEVLSTLSASDVDRVELISTSSAKYDASGSSGIVNIIMKRNRTKGFNGSTSATIGTKDKKSGSFSANMRTGKVNFFGAYNYKADWANRDYHVERLIYKQNTLMTENADVDFGNRYHVGKLGMDYLINNNNTFTISATYRDILQNWNGTYDYVNQDLLSSAIPNLSYRTSAVDLDLQSWVYNASYIHKFTKKGQSLSLDFAHTDNRADNSGDYYWFDGSPENKSNSTSDFYKTARKETLSQIDYVHPFGDNGKFETGYLYRSNEIDYEDQYDLSTAFNYKENIHGLYAMYTGIAGKFEYELGVRAEYSDIETNSDFQDDYFDLFPSVHLSYAFSDKKQFQLAYDRMIYRPNSGMLNPFQNLRDPENQRLGSQSINAYYNDNIEMSMAFDRDKISYKTTLYFNYYNKLINQYRSINDEGQAVVSYGNFESKLFSALEFETSTKLNDWWSLNAYVAGIYEEIDPGDNFNFGFSNMWELEGKITSMMNFKKLFKLQTSFRYQSEILTAQGKYQNLYYLDLGMSRRVLKGKGVISFTANDIFNTFRFKVHSSDSEFYNKEILYRETQIAKLSFRYYFGKRYGILRAKPKKSGMRHSEMDI